MLRLFAIAKIGNLVIASLFANVPCGRHFAGHPAYTNTCVTLCGYLLSTGLFLPLDHIV